MGGRNNVSCEARRYFRNKKREYLRDKINELAMNSNKRNIRYLCRGINEFKRGYQLRNNLVKDKNGDLLADSNNTLNRWKNYYSQLLNVHNISDVRHIEVLTAEPLVPGLTRLDINFIQNVIKYLLSRLSPYIDENIWDHQCEFRR
jgi:hypothetical protein